MSQERWTCIQLSHAARAWHYACTVEADDVNEAMALCAVLIIDAFGGVRS